MTKHFEFKCPVCGDYQILKAVVSITKQTVKMPVKLPAENYHFVLEYPDQNSIESVSVDREYFECWDCQHILSDASNKPLASAEELYQYLKEQNNETT